MGRGSSKAGGSSAISNNPAVEKTLNKIIKQTRDLKNEQYRIVDENGNILVVNRGDKHSVGSTVGEKRENLDGATSIHNHPNDDWGGTFSDADVRDFGFGARAIVATGKEGTYVLTNKNYGKPNSHEGWRPMQDEMAKIQRQDRSYLEDRKAAEAKLKSSTEWKQMDRLSKMWVKKKDSGASKDELDSIANKYDKYSKSYKKKLDLTVRKMVTEPTHEWLKKNAKKYGFDYKFIPRH